MAEGSHISDRERAEACSVSGQGRGHLYEIQLGHLCNDRCVFCSSGQLTQMKLARALKLDPILQALDEAKKSGARRVTFLGGEPTIQKNFPAALKHAVELGFEEIVIFTNGVMLPHPGFIDRIVALGKFEWRISIQGATEEAHVAVTLRKDSFQRIVTGLKMLRERGQHVTSNICVNERSYRSLPAFPSLVQEHGIRQLHVDIVRPSSTGERTEEYLREIMPRYSDMAPSMAAMLQGFEDLQVDCDVSLGNLPLCILPQWAHKIHHGGEDTVTQAADANGLEVAVDKYQWHASMRRHVKACDACVFRPHCTGIFSKYLELYGDSEFRGVTAAELLELDPRQRSFVLHVEPLLHRLQERIPPGWALQKEVDRRGNQIDLRYTTSRGGRVTLHVTPPVAGAHLLTKDFAIRVSVSKDVPEEDLEQFVAWAGQCVSVTTRNLEAMFAAHRHLRLQLRGLDRARQLADRLTEHGAFNGYNLICTREEPSALVAELAAPNGRIDLVFHIRTEGLRPKVTLDARPLEGTDRIAAAATIRSVVAFLQGAGG